LLFNPFTSLGLVNSPHRLLWQSRVALLLVLKSGWAKQIAPPITANLFVVGMLQRQQVCHNILFYPFSSHRFNVNHFYTVDAIAISPAYSATENTLKTSAALFESAFSRTCKFCDASC
jgi:hypothetical protein